MPRPLALRQLTHRLSLKRKVKKLPAFGPTILLARVLFKAADGDTDAVEVLRGHRTQARDDDARRDVRKFVSDVARFLFVRFKEETQSAQELRAEFNSLAYCAASAGGSHGDVRGVQR